MRDTLDPAEFVGRREIRHDVADPERLVRLAALLDRAWTIAEPLPPLGHFLFFRPDERQSRIASDGHPLRDNEGLLPNVQLPRRMWAGSRITFLKPIEPGVGLVRESLLRAAEPKTGRTGTMLFCTVEHVLSRADTAEELVREEQDIVYREAHQAGVVAERVAPAPDWTAQSQSERTVDAVMLFRYSALTFNAHRIHYDRQYAQEQEGYPGLVVHGPLLATLMFDRLMQNAGDARIAQFDFRAVSPVFDGEPLSIEARTEGNAVKLAIVGPAGVAMRGHALLA